jgi:hypothetical protein
MKNILFFAPYLKPVSNAAALRCHALVKALRDKAYNVKTVSYGGDSDSKLIIKNQDSKGSFLKRLLIEFLSGIEVGVRVLFSKGDLIVLSFPPFLPALFGATICIITRKKYVLDVRDIYPEPYFIKGLISEKRAIAKIIKAWAGLIYRRSNHIVVVTKSFINIIRGYGIPDSKITLIRNGYAPELFSTSSAKFEKFTVVFHGHLSHFRELHLIPTLAKKNFDMNFVVVGCGRRRSPGRFLPYTGASKLKVLWSS